jgi:hypothetical protein
MKWSVGCTVGILVIWCSCLVSGHSPVLQCLNERESASVLGGSPCYVDARHDCVVLYGCHRKVCEWDLLAEDWMCKSQYEWTTNQAWLNHTEAWKSTGAWEEIAWEPVACKRKQECMTAPFGCEQRGNEWFCKLLMDLDEWDDYHTPTTASPFSPNCVIE